MVQIALVLGTWALVIITAIYMRRSAKITAESNRINREANDILRKELKSRLKPQLDLTAEPSLSVSEGSYIMRVTGMVHNSGSISANDVRVGNAETKSEDLRDIVKQKDEIFRRTHMLGTMAPGASEEVSFVMEWASDRELGKLTVWISYDYVDIEPEKSEKVVLCFVSGGGTMAMRQFEKVDIDKAKSPG